MFQRFSRHGKRDYVQPLHLREIADSAQQSVRDSGSAAAAPCNLFRGVGVDCDAENGCGAAEYPRDFRRSVHFQPHQHTEAVAERAGQHTRTRRRAYQRKLFEGQAYAARHRSFAGHEIQRKVLHRGIKHFLDVAVETVYLVNEEDVPFFQIGEDGGKVCGTLNRRAGRHPYLRSEFVGYDVRKRGLSKPRRSVKQDVVECLSPRLRRRDVNFEVVFYLVLSDIVRHTLRAQRTFRFVLFEGQTADNSFVVHNHRSAVLRQNFIV